MNTPENGTLTQSSDHSTLEHSLVAAVTKHASAQHTVEAAAASRDDALRAALAAGMKPALARQITGLSRQRILQIKNHSR